MEVGPWALLTGFAAAINLGLFLFVRGRWGRATPVLAIAAVLGTIAGNAVGGWTGFEVIVVGQFHLLAASVGAQLAMLGVLLLGALLPTPSGARPVAGGRRDSNRDAGEPDR